MLRPDAIFKFDGTSYTDLSNNPKTNSSIDFISSTDDIFYIGLRRRFIGLYVTLSTLGSYDSISYKYWNGEEWKYLSLLDSYAFSVSKYQRWVVPTDWEPLNFTDTFPHSATAPDNVERFWIKIEAGGVTTQAVISKIRCLPYATYASSGDVAAKLGLNSEDIFTTVSEPLSSFDVEDFIVRAEDRIDYRTRKSWRFNAEPEELLDFNLEGVRLHHRDIIKVFNAYLWDGSSFDLLTEGRNQDYFVDNDRGMLFFTRFFLPPARYRYPMYGMALGSWKGEFRYAVKVDYSWGRDLETSRDFHIVNNLAAKMAAIECLSSSNFVALVPEASALEEISQRIDRWEREIEDQLENLTALIIE